MIKSATDFIASLENDTHIEAKGSLRLIAYILIFVFAFESSFLGLPDFFSRGEAREAIVVQSMVTSENWILPKAYNEVVPSKPPLFHWMAGLASLALGNVNEFTTRLPSLVFSVAALGLFLMVLKSFFSPRDLLIFALLLTFSFEWLKASMIARVDMVHASCLSSGLLMSFVALESSKIRVWVIASIFFALAILGKGPVAIAIPIGILTIWALITSTKRTIPLVSIFICLSFSLLIASTWYIAAYYQAPEEFIGKFWYENVARFTSTMEDRST